MRNLLGLGAPANLPFCRNPSQMTFLGFARHPGDPTWYGRVHMTCTTDTPLGPVTGPKELLVDLGWVKNNLYYIRNAPDADVVDMIVQRGKLIPPERLAAEIEQHKRQMEQLRRDNLLADAQARGQVPAAPARGADPGGVEARLEDAAFRQKGEVNKRLSSQLGWAVDRSRYADAGAVNLVRDLIAFGTAAGRFYPDLAARVKDGLLGESYVELIRRVKRDKRQIDPPVHLYVRVPGDNDEFLNSPGMTFTQAEIDIAMATPPAPQASPRVPKPAAPVAPKKAPLLDRPIADVKRMMRESALQLGWRVRDGGPYRSVDSDALISAVARIQRYPYVQLPVQVFGLIDDVWLRAILTTSPSVFPVRTATDEAPRGLFTKLQTNVVAGASAGAPLAQNGPKAKKLGLPEYAAGALAIFMATKING